MGHRQRWTLEDGREVEVETLALQPLIFRIANYLTDAEVDALLAAARALPLDSGTTFDSGAACPGCRLPQQNQMPLNDFDNDGRLSLSEFRFALDQLADAHLTLEDAQEVVRLLKIDANADSFLSVAELRAPNASDAGLIGGLVNQLLAAQPAKRSRHSDLTWLSAEQTPTVSTLQRRLQTVTGLPRSVLSNSEVMQAVRYGEDGQYALHHDSGAASQPRSGRADALPCCHLTAEADRQLASEGAEMAPVQPVTPCRLCRFATVFYQLNTIAQGRGGETVFPLANNATMSALQTAAMEADAALAEGRVPAGVSPGAARRRLRSAVHHFRAADEARQEHYCHAESGVLRVPPVKGTALLWYNHETYRNHSLGPMDRLSLHGGCRLQPAAGGEAAPERWVANHWCEVSEDLAEDERLFQAAKRKQQRGEHRSHRKKKRKGKG